METNNTISKIVEFAHNGNDKIIETTDFISGIKTTLEYFHKDAAFICKAVNNYDSLLSALKELTEITRWVEDNYEKGCGHLAKLERAEAAIKQAETN